MLLTPMTRKAMTIAYAAHHGHTDRYGVPDIFHTARVAEGFTNEAKACVAWLQDVVEDGCVSLEDIRLAGFGGYICEALELLARNDAVPYGNGWRPSRPTPSPGRSSWRTCGTKWISPVSPSWTGRTGSCWRKTPVPAACCRGRPSPEKQRRPP